MFFRLLLLFTCLPLLELYILLQVGSIIGALNTILLVIFTGVLGAYLARQEGLRTLEKIRSLMARGEMPGESLIDAMLILVAGFMLITPGILTDLLGVLILIPATRRPIRRWIQGKLERKFSAVDRGVYCVDPDSPETPP